MTWSTEWLLDFPLEKTAITLIQQHHLKNCYHHIGNFHLQINLYTWLRRCAISNKLRFDEYVEKIVAAVYAKSNSILRAFQTRNIVALLRLFCIYIRPLLEHCTLLYSPAKQSIIIRIEGVQKKIRKQVFGRNRLFDVSYNEMKGGLDLMLHHYHLDE